MTAEAPRRMRIVCSLCGDDWCPTDRELLVEAQAELNDVSHWGNVTPERRDAARDLAARISRHLARGERA